MEIHDDSVVTFQYQLATREGDFYEESGDDEAVVYLHGRQTLLPAIEEGLSGHGSGETVVLEIPPELGYGEFDPRLELELPWEAFPDDLRDQVRQGFEFTARNPFDDGRSADFVVVEVGPDGVGVSGNHRLAGRTLVMQVAIVSVRPARAAEIIRGTPDESLQLDDA